MRGIIIEDHTDALLRRIGGIDHSQELDEFAAAVTLDDVSMNMARQQINGGHQRHGSVAAILVVAHDALVLARKRLEVGVEVVAEAADIFERVRGAAAAGDDLPEGFVEVAVADGLGGIRQAVG